jgi:hypothetical protein
VRVERLRLPVVLALMIGLIVGVRLSHGGEQAREDVLGPRTGTDGRVPAGDNRAD